MKKKTIKDLIEDIRSLDVLEHDPVEDGFYYEYIPKEDLEILLQKYEQQIWLQEIEK